MIQVKVIILTILLTLIQSATLQAQKDDIIFEHIPLDQGRSQSSVFSILQDSKGYMWFGTDNGLNKYDGYRYTVYNYEPYDSNSLSNNSVFSIYEDQSEILWLGTVGGGLINLMLLTFFTAS